jgi:signal transduction histidine kinase
MLNTLVLISGLLSIFGAYEIQVGAQMHKLNYLHQKNIDGIENAVTAYDLQSGSLDAVRTQILLVREQPIECLEMIGAVERVVMEIIGTADTITICEEDEKLADSLLADITAFEANEISKPELLAAFQQGLIGFADHGVQFQPVVEQTVKFVFLMVISFVIAKAVIVPVFGFLLSTSVSKDYATLSNTKSQLIDEQGRNEAIQEEKMTAMSTMVAGIAHEINTPVGISVTATSHAHYALLETREKYEKDDLTIEGLVAFFDDMAEAIGIVEKNLARTSDLVKSFKQVSVDQTVDEIRPVYLRNYTEDILTSMRPIIKKSRARITLNCVETLVADIYPGAFSQILTNLVTNAVTHAFTEGEEGQISIDIMPMGELLTLVFSDNGKGIEDEDIGSIFNPFFTTRRGDGGTGLGLHIVHNLVVDRMKGKIKCISEPGEGTRFFINFPCRIREIELQTI